MGTTQLEAPETRSPIPWREMVSPYEAPRPRRSILQLVTPLIPLGLAIAEVPVSPLPASPRHVRAWPLASGVRPAADSTRPGEPAKGAAQRPRDQPRADRPHPGVLGMDRPAGVARDLRSRVHDRGRVG